MTFRVGGAAKHGDKRIWIGIGGDRIGKRPLIVIGGGAREIEMDLHPLQRIGGRTRRHPRVSKRAPGADPVAGFALPAGLVGDQARIARILRSEEHTSELQSLMRISYAVFCLKKKQTSQKNHHRTMTTSAH